jgi:hypothetical protein
VSQDPLPLLRGPTHFAPNVPAFGRQDVGNGVLELGSRDFVQHSSSVPYAAGVRCGRPSLILLSDLLVAVLGDTRLAASGIRIEVFNVDWQPSTLHSFKLGLPLPLASAGYQPRRARQTASGVSGDTRISFASRRTVCTSRGLLLKRVCA